MKPLVLAVILAFAAIGRTGRGPLTPESIAGTANSVSPGASPTRYTNIVQIPLFIQDANGHPPTGAETPLFEAHKHNPILSPDGHQVTLSEFNAVDGSARATRCARAGSARILTGEGARACSPGTSTRAPSTERTCRVARW